MQPSPLPLSPSASSGGFQTPNAGNSPSGDALAFTFDGYTPEEEQLDTIIHKAVREASKAKNGKKSGGCGSNGFISNTMNYFKAKTPSSIHIPSEVGVHEVEDDDGLSMSVEKDGYDPLL